MTDGIIQKVFKEYYNTDKLSNVSFYDKFIKQTLKDVEQELIEKIKQIHTNRPYYQLDNGVKVYNDMLIQLIGDNQE